MNVRMFILLLVLSGLISGCAAKIEKKGIDVVKASELNASLGVAYLTQGRYEVALNKLKKAINYNDENANAHHYLAVLYNRLKQNEQAEEHFIKALDITDQDSSIKNNYASFLCEKGNYEEGLILFDEVLVDPLYKEKSKVYENKGICNQKQGNILLAENFFTEALKRNKKLPVALLGMAQIEFDKKNLKAATDYLNRRNKISRYSAPSLWLAILIERKSGRKGRAGSYALLLKNKFPDSKEVIMLKKLNIK